jgi:hypothetical protein
MIRRTAIAFLTLATLSVAASFLVLISRPFPPAASPALRTYQPLDHNWTWGRAGTHIAFARQPRPNETRSGTLIKRPGFAMLTGANLVYMQLSIWIPLGLIVLFAVYPAIALIAGPLRRRHRRRKGLCTTCGYNLTGNTTGTCPECGSTL